MQPASGDIRIGISGWAYAPWRKSFYPAGLVHRLELPFAAAKLNSIEINGSFYSLQRPSSYRAWYDATPDNFVFSVKGGQYITHMRRLRDAAEPLANFFASGVLELRQKLGPILWQFPPNFSSIPSDSTHFSNCCRAIRSRLLLLQSDMGKWPKIAFRSGPIASVRFATQ